VRDEASVVTILARDRIENTVAALLVGPTVPGAAVAVERDLVAVVTHLASVEAAVATAGRQAHAFVAGAVDAREAACRTIGLLIAAG
jgi:hypothetical protein